MAIFFGKLRRDLLVIIIEGKPRIGELRVGALFLGYGGVDEVLGEFRPVSVHFAFLRRDDTPKMCHSFFVELAPQDLHAEEPAAPVAGLEFYSVLFSIYGVVGGHGEGVSG